MSRSIDQHRLFSRRSLLSGGGILLSAAALGLAAWPAADVRAQRSARTRGFSEVPPDELMKPSELPDLVLGSPDAKVTIIEYASMTCSHCADFHNKVFEQLKTKYIDTGKVRFIFREFPLDNLAAAASMLARCAGGEKTHPLIAELFKRQDEWAFVRGNPVPKLFEVAKQAGFTKEAFDKCIGDKAALDKVGAARKIASDKFGVSSTPTFFVNGKRLDGRTDQLETFEREIERALKS